MPDYTLTGELAEDRLDLGIISGDGPTFAQVAGRAGEHKVLHRVLAAPGDRDDVVKVKYLSRRVIEVQDPTLRDLGPRRSLRAVTADASVAFGDAITDRLRNVLLAFIHATSIATSPDTQTATVAADAGAQR